MLILSRLLIVVAVVGLLRTSTTLQKFSRDLDDRALLALRTAMRATEESGYPRQTIPVLILITALAFMLSMYFTQPYVR